MENFRGSTKRTEKYSHEDPTLSSSLSFNVARYGRILRQSAGLPRWKIQQDQAGDRDGNTEAGKNPDRFFGEQSPEETPERKQVGNCGHMGGGDLGEQAVVEQVGEA